MKSNNEMKINKVKVCYQTPPLLDLNLGQDKKVDERIVELEEPIRMDGLKEFIRISKIKEHRDRSPILMQDGKEVEKDIIIAWNNANLTPRKHIQYTKDRKIYRKSKRKF